MSTEDDLPPEAARSQHLAYVFANHEPDLSADFRSLKRQLEREGRWEYVGDVRHSEDYVPSEFDSHGQELLREQEAVLARIEEGLISKLRRGLLSAWAREGSPLAQWRAIPASAWRTLKIDDPGAGTASAPGVTLFDVRVGLPAAPDPTPRPPHRRAAGRPSHRSLVWPEFLRRAEAGEMETKLAREAAALRDWFKANYADEAPPTEKTIREWIRGEYWSRLKEGREI